MAGPVGRRVRSRICAERLNDDDHDERPPNQPEIHRRPVIIFLTPLATLTLEDG